MHKLSSRTPRKAHPSTAPFQLSVMLWTIDKQRGVDRSIEIVAEAGYRGIELVSEFESWSPQDIRRIMSKMSSLGLIFDTIDGGGYTLADPEARADDTGKTCDPHECGPGPWLLTTHPHLGQQGRRTCRRRPRRTAFTDTLKAAGELAGKNDMHIVIEPIDPYERPDCYLTSVVQAFEIVRAVDSKNVTVLYDFYHEQQWGGNLIKKLEENFQLVSLVHIADVPGRHEPGSGEIDYHSIYRKLAELHYNKFIAMEFYPTGDALQLLKTARLDALKAASGIS